MKLPKYVLYKKSVIILNKICEKDNYKYVLHLPKKSIGDKVNLFKICIFFHYFVMYVNLLPCLQ